MPVIIPPIGPVTVTYGTKPLDYLDDAKYTVVETWATEFVFGGLDKTAKANEKLTSIVAAHGDELVYAEVTVTDGGLPGFFYDVHTLAVLKKPDYGVPTPPVIPPIEIPPTVTVPIVGEVPTVAIAVVVALIIILVIAS